MHLIPQSGAHWHILLSVFPSFGLLILLGFHLAGFRTGNSVIERTCLFLFGALAVLAVPIYFSGTGAMASAPPKMAKAAMATHAGWGQAALAALVITGVVAWIELVRSLRGRRAAAAGFGLVSGLAVVALGLMVVSDGWEINHRELLSVVAIPDVSTSQVWSHVHIILNHAPTVGFVFALAFFIIALVAADDGLKRGSLVLFVICCVLGVPTYVTGTATMWALTQPPMADISKAVINAHRDMALLTLVGLAFTGAASWVELWRYRYFKSFSGVSLTLVLLFAVVTLGIMTETGHRGGLINHPEIRGVADLLPTDPTIGLSADLEAVMKSMVWFIPWQTVHFFGYCLIFGAVFAVVLRALGYWKSVSFAAVHRLLFLGFLGVLMNVVSGMLMMLADSYRYVVNDYTFAPKIALITIGATAALYFSLSDRLWRIKAGEEAPQAAKWVAAVVLLAWTGVIVCGRLLPYL